MLDVSDKQHIAEWTAYKMRLEQDENMSPETRDARLDSVNHLLGIMERKQNEGL